MSSVFKAVAAVAAVASMVLPPPFNLIAKGVAVVASSGAAVTQHRPPARGSTTQITIGSNQTMPYAMGRTYPRAAMILDVGYGGKVDGVPNPYRSFGFVWSGGGPIEGFESFQADFATVALGSSSGGLIAGEASGYYDNFIWVDSQKGECPEADALTGHFGAIATWGSDYKLSGYAAVMVTCKFDRKGKVFASGLPQFGGVMKGVLVYDQRQDDSYAGGSGACRALDETTYVGGDAAQNPSCHGVTYALGRWQGEEGPDGAPKKVFGCGFAVEAIDWAAWTEFANVCDANAWKIGGSIFEPGSRWDNLKRICQCGGGTPVFVGGLLSVSFPRPRTAIDTISLADLADGEIRIPAMRSWKRRLNGIIPTYPSEEHHWEMVQSDLVSASTYVEEDGEEKSEERPYELVPYKDQAAQLAAYELANGREIDGISLPVKPRLVPYRIGAALEIGADMEAELGLAAGQLVVITGRRFVPLTATTELQLVTETTAKHDFALGKTGTAPPSPSLPTGEDTDEAASVLTDLELQAAIRLAYPTGLTLVGEDVGGDGHIIISDHVDEWPGFGAVAVTGTTLTGKTLGEQYFVYCDFDEAADAEPEFGATTDYGDALNSAAHPFRMYLNQVIVLPESGDPPTGGEGAGGGYGGGPIVPDVIE